MNHKKIKRLISLIVAVASVIVMTGCKKESVQTNENAVQVGDTAPEFTVSLTNGQRFKLAENTDKVVLLNFWATWCNPCVKEMPAIQKIYEEYPDTVQVIGANDGEDRDLVDSFVKKNDYTYPICYDMDGKLAEAYPSDGIPYTIIIGKDGKVAATFYGAKDVDKQYDKLKEAIDEALAQ